jgi:hypothetical protein
VFPSWDELFEGRYFGREIIVLCVRRYLRFTLSFRGLGEMMRERGLSIAHAIIIRRAHHYAQKFGCPLFDRDSSYFWRIVEQQRTGVSMIDHRVVAQVQCTQPTHASHYNCRICRIYHEAACTTSGVGDDAAGLAAN